MNASEAESSPCPSFGGTPQPAHPSIVASHAYCGALDARIQLPAAGDGWQTPSLGGSPGVQPSLLGWETPSLGGSPYLASPPPALRPSPGQTECEVDMAREANILFGIMDEIEVVDDDEDDSTGSDVGDLDALDSDEDDLLGWPPPGGEGWGGGTPATPLSVALATVAGSSTALALPMKLENVLKQPGNLSDAYSGFSCRCTAKCGGGNCVEDLNMTQLKQASSLLHPEGDKTSPSTFRKALHVLLWTRKEALPAPNSRGHNYKITNWSWDGKPLCRAGFMKVCGGTYQAHRDMYGAVLRGISPSDLACERGATLVARTEAKKQGAQSDKESFATTWLATKYLVTMEFMPNERRIDQRQ